ncbi:Uncharacterised protein [Mycobacteroides abscessus subsp. abscessus]|uniref:Uncharacterized protein n=2 Tax=Mycobacteroides abscessus TaxID=36809 RepID=A0AB33T3L4_9MYCO|nr:hypothetical protein [Mycobacteroides abscessus]EUA47973.1 putative membrane protein [Mycobacteroides abscessus 21]AMU57109.1 hypothetical protein A3O02_19440 [Mycobacteroides abscessus]EIC66575.1 hypothetical protein S7W_14980 [Mycobacteroides abscessus M94]EIT89924.1 hypothetical protein MA4S0303_3724 [Mycobacteroides abscessus 4S-0303]EIT91918.1 hypothetical protein MA4S0726RB_3249 [Mycobacteroides abscessus 4S-0726-RB]
MINRQSIGDVALPTLSIMLPFAIIVGQLGFDPCRWWIVYCTAAAVAMGLAVGTSRMRKTSGARPTTSPPWTFFWIGLAALTAVQGGFYSQFRNQCPVVGPIIPIDMFLEWIVAPTVLVAAALSVCRRGRAHI